MKRRSRIEDTPEWHAGTLLGDQLAASGASMAETVHAIFTTVGSAADTDQFLDEVERIGSVYREYGEELLKEVSRRRKQSQ